MASFRSLPSDTEEPALWREAPGSLSPCPPSPGVWGQTQPTEGDSLPDCLRHVPDAQLPVCTHIVLRLRCAASVLPGFGCHSLHKALCDASRMKALTVLFVYMEYVLHVREFLTCSKTSRIQRLKWKKHLIWSQICSSLLYRGWYAQNTGKINSKKQKNKTL